MPDYSHFLCIDSYHCVQDLYHDSFSPTYLLIVVVKVPGGRYLSFNNNRYEDFSKKARSCNKSSRYQLYLVISNAGFN
ncbi:hypothetical protein HI914_03179 [Erysiphe necator]|nr:hypothetical protein HI914_03179 [Erysiphe necator]